MTHYLPQLFEFVISHCWVPVKVENTYLCRLNGHEVWDVWQPRANQVAVCVQHTVLWQCCRSVPWFSPPHLPLSEPRVPAGSPSWGGDVVQPSLSTPFIFSAYINFCLYVPFNCVSFHESSQQLSIFSLCSTGLISALSDLSTILSLYESLPQPWCNPLWLTGLKAPIN